MSKFTKAVLITSGVITALVGATVGILAILGKLSVITDFIKKLNEKIKSIEFLPQKEEIASEDAAEEKFIIQED